MSKFTEESGTVTDHGAVHMRANQVRLVIAQLLGGIGIASGVAVGGLLAEQISGTPSAAGFVQTASVLGAGFLAIPLARLAAKRGRNWALAIGFGLGGAGAALVIASAVTTQFWMLLLGMLFVGSGRAANLQARYAATELVDPKAQARAMSIIMWATTVGSILGPNLSEPGSVVGRVVGIDPLSGPFLFSVVAFTCAALVVATLRVRPAPSGRTGQMDDATNAPDPSRKPIGSVAAIRIACHNPDAIFAMVSIVAGQMMMTSVMVMTPIHMSHGGMSLTLIGVVISVHTLGMYGASPLFGFLADKFGPRNISLLSTGIFAVSLVLGGLDAFSTHSEMPRLLIALFLLGFGWSASLIGGSALLNRSVDDDIKIPLQGGVDSLMNFGAAILAALAGPVLALGGFLAVNVMAVCILVPFIFFGVRALARR
ncbi:MFS transporter [Spelaeicoccus albus]|uniref:MFS family permease n=1 Tax=Spelaeicoccus albus TaxID=1280376 RepID=A0A7Z0AAU7_9MICO|nr:MFS transporter [Spelaeicoccus albus]NYI66796.1 MFS family permease [Spelaeicoccus albus]